MSEKRMEKQNSLENGRRKFKKWEKQGWVQRLAILKKADYN